MRLFIYASKPLNNLKIEYTAAVEKTRYGSPQIWLGFSALSVILLASTLLPPFFVTKVVPCLFKSVTGIPCAGCGMTRAFLAIGRGNLYEAFRFNPNCFFAFGVILFLWVNMIVGFIAGKEVMIRLTSREKIMVYVLAAISVVIIWGYNLFLNNLIW